MSRKLLLMTVAVLGCFAAGAGIWSNRANSAGGQTTVPKVDFDHAFNTTATPRRESMLEVLAKVYLDPGLADATAVSIRLNPSATKTKRDFESAFAATTVPHRQNTPPIREKLRNEGWRRILGSN